jgi:hypothetical protein
MIDVKQAADIASQYLLSLFADKNPTNVQLEEVELSEDEKYWLITLSFMEQSPLSPIIPRKKSYKLFKINADTGQVQSMKIREVA